MRRSQHPPVLKKLGQHFLTDLEVLNKIADALNLGPSDTVVEIGPGRGALTDILVERAGKVVAIELDRALAEALRHRYRNPEFAGLRIRTGDAKTTESGIADFELIENDVLKVKVGEVVNDDYVLAGNVPYYITTPILFHSLQQPMPRVAVFMIQHEVAERAVAGPGSKVYGALSVNLQVIADVEYLFLVPPKAFFPPPGVDSAVIRVTPKANPLIPAEDQRAFQSFVLAIFGLRRKQLGRVVRTVSSRPNGMSAEEAIQLLEGIGLDPEVRPEVLPPSDFVKLFRALRAQ